MKSRASCFVGMLGIAPFLVTDKAAKPLAYFMASMKLLVCK